MKTMHSFIIMVTLLLPHIFNAMDNNNYDNDIFKKSKEVETKLINRIDRITQRLNGNLETLIDRGTIKEESVGKYIKYVNDVLNNMLRSCEKDLQSIQKSTALVSNARQTISNRSNAPLDTQADMKLKGLVQSAYDGLLIQKNIDGELFTILVDADRISLAKIDAYCLQCANPDSQTNATSEKK